MSDLRPSNDIELRALIRSIIREELHEQASPCYLEVRTTPPGAYLREVVREELASMTGTQVSVITIMQTQPLGEPLLNFTIDLYKYLVEKSGRTGNMLFSPFSISTALSMTLAGARGNTARQLADVLGITREEANACFYGLLPKLEGLAPNVKLHVANRMYSEQTFPNSYGTTVESVDFGKRYEEVRRRINAWVEEVTEPKLRKFSPTTV
ncbi:hypothetical protein HPB52_023176 [Rhipicephalus sanguineus]|uniref:Serpin domain-containing protein n=1 Tax=Rhipicephalus sanguineus TaxID=34632 RepID=A0A9D4T6C6_RHISA|nr:hypothetical protein HPB52_023176 [Rhipicephalus sanguineus]